MKNRSIKYVWFAFVLLLCWRCGETEIKCDDWYDIQHIPTRAEDDFTVDQLFECSLNAINAAIMRMYEGSSLGRKVIKALLQQRQGRPKIKFVYNPELKDCMLYNGRDVIEYGQILVPLNDVVVSLLFHEIFHVYQYGINMIHPLNKEIEAYVAAWLLFEELPGKKSYTPVFLNNSEFTQYIKNLAVGVNKKKGKYEGTETDFTTNYSLALEILRHHKLYEKLQEPGDGFYVNWTFDNLFNVLKFKL